MNFRNNNLIIGVFVLMAFLSMAVFGLLQFSHVMHSKEAPMVNCPYQENSYSICNNVLEHISTWQKFVNVISSSLFVLFALFFILYFFSSYDFWKQKQKFFFWRYYLYHKSNPSTGELIKWLSLFENSPSFSYARQR